VEINEKGYSFFSKKEKHSCDKKEKSEFFLILHLPGRILKKPKQKCRLFICLLIFIFSHQYIRQWAYC